MVDPAAAARITILIALFASFDANPFVRVKQGDISGVYVQIRGGRRISSFLGIPYAEPPVGDLRFRNPVAKGPWNETLRADKDGPQCVQITLDMGVAGQEDCLYMNVHSPKLLKKNETMDQNLLPVMVYIHGGKFVKGNGSSYVYGPDYLLKEDVVLVTLNYRLGIFGFLSTGDMVAPGNFGLKDQVVVLKWVQENIKAFGGDPKRVTLFGNSAGAVMVNLHVISEKSYGLFQQYIIQSGCILNPWAYQENPTYARNAESVALSYKCPVDNTTAMVECFRNLTAKQLASTNSIFDVYALFAQITWGPTVEPDHPDAFLTQSPLHLFLQGKMQDMPFIAGVVKDEGLFAANLLYDKKLFAATLEKGLQTSIAIIMMLFADMPVVSSYRLARHVKDFYFSEKKTKSKTQFADDFTRFLTDVFFLYPQYRYVEYMALRMRSPSWFYSFEYYGTFTHVLSAKDNSTNLGVCHEDDVIYLFNIPPTILNNPNLTMSETDYRMVDQMVDLWTSFVIRGIPISSRLENPFMWRPYVDNSSYLQIGNQSSVNATIRYTFYEDRMQFWCHRTASYPLGVFKIGDRIATRFGR